MGYTEGTWRLKALFVIIVVMSLLFTSQFILLDIDLVEYEGDGWTYTIYNASDNDTSGGMVQDAGGDIFSTLGFILSIATFSAPETMPEWGKAVMRIFAIILYVTLAYIVYTFLYEIVKGLPFT